MQQPGAAGWADLSWHNPRLPNLHSLPCFYKDLSHTPCPSQHCHPLGIIPECFWMRINPEWPYLVPPSLLWPGPCFPAQPRIQQHHSCACARDTSWAVTWGLNAQRDPRAAPSLCTCPVATGLGLTLVTLTRLHLVLQLLPGLRSTNPGKKGVTCRKWMRKVCERWNLQRKSIWNQVAEIQNVFLWNRPQEKVGRKRLTWHCDTVWEGKDIELWKLQGNKEG